MEMCLTQLEMDYFLSLINAAVTVIKDGYIVHATAGDVLWIFNGECYQVHPR